MLVMKSSVSLGFSFRWGEDIHKETLFDRKQTHCVALWHGYAGPTSDTDLTKTDASGFTGELNKMAGATGHWVLSWYIEDIPVLRLTGQQDLLKLRVCFGGEFRFCVTIGDMKLVCLCVCVCVCVCVCECACMHA